MVGVGGLVPRALLSKGWHFVDMLIVCSVVWCVVGLFVANGRGEYAMHCGKVGRGLAMQDIL